MTHLSPLLLVCGWQYFPTLKFLHQGTVYNYEGKRDQASLVAFALVRSSD